MLRMKNKGGVGQMSKLHQDKLAAIANKIDPKRGKDPSTGNKEKPQDYKPSNGVVAASKLRDCRFCCRPFTTDRIEVHEAICQRSLKKKKNTKPFVDAKDVGAKSKSKGQPQNSKRDELPPAPHWKEAHEQLLSTFEASDGRRGSVGSGQGVTLLPPPPGQGNSDYVQCPHCGRRFNPEAAQRHIPQCKNFDYNKPKK